VPRPRRDAGPLHLLVDSTGLKLRGAGEWLVEKHGTKTRRSWRKLHIGLDADTGQIVAATLTNKERDDGAEVGPLLDQVAGPVASFTADGAYDQEGVVATVAERHPEAAIIVPPRSTAVPSETAENRPTMTHVERQLAYAEAQVNHPDPHFRLLLAAIYRPDLSHLRAIVEEERAEKDNLAHSSDRGCAVNHTICNCVHYCREGCTRRGFPVR